MTRVLMMSTNEATPHVLPRHANSVPYKFTFNENSITFQGKRFSPGIGFSFKHMFHKLKQN